MRYPYGMHSGCLRHVLYTPCHCSMGFSVSSRCLYVCCLYLCWVGGPPSLWMLQLHMPRRFVMSRTLLCASFKSRVLRHLGFPDSRIFPSQTAVACLPQGGVELPSRYFTFRIHWFVSKCLFEAAQSGC